MESEKWLRPSGEMCRRGRLHETEITELLIAAARRRPCASREREEFSHPTDCELICFARKRNLGAQLRQNNTTGKSVKTCPAIRVKIFRLTRRPNHPHNSARLTADEGRWPSSRTCGEMRWTRRARRRACVKRTAKSCGPDAAVLALSSEERASWGRRWQKSRSPGRARSKP